MHFFFRGVLLSTEFKIPLEYISVHFCSFSIRPTYFLLRISFLKKNREYSGAPNRKCSTFRNDNRPQMVELSVSQKSHPICSSPNSSLSSNFLSLKLFPAFIYFSKSWMADASNGNMPESKSFECSDEGNPDLTTEQKAKEKKGQKQNKKENEYF